MRRGDEALNAMNPARASAARRSSSTRCQFRPLADEGDKPGSPPFNRVVPSIVGSCRCIPDWYHLGMSKQIAVRLSDDLVAFVDDVVASGSERSRAAVVTRALERERRRVIAARDAEILARTGPDPELEGLAEYAVTQPFAPG